MAAPITALERRLQSRISNNSLIRAATQTTQRKQVASLTYDTHRNVSAIGRRTLCSIGRWLYWNFDAVRAVVDEMARLAVSSYLPQYYGSDKEWGRMAEDFLWEQDKFVDVRGFPHNMASIRRAIVRETLIDGDLGILLADVQGEPRIQTWRSHRIDLSSTKGTGQYEESPLVDGVVTNDYGRPIAYALTNEKGTFQQYVLARDFILAYDPKHCDQVRGISELGVSAFNFQDVEESRRFQLLAQKIGATYAFKVFNEDGSPDATANILSAPASDPNSDNSITAVPQELHQEGRMIYFRSNSGDNIEPVYDDRPGANWQEFQEKMVRGALAGLGWSYDFTIDPTRIGGAPLRVVVDKLERKLVEIREHILNPVLRRIDGWRIAKAINNGRLPANAEWYAWEYQGPAQITADKKYEAQVSEIELTRNLSSLQRQTGRRGEYWEDVLLQRMQVMKFVRDRAPEFGLDPDDVLGETFGKTATAQPDMTIEEADNQAQNDDNQ